MLPEIFENLTDFPLFKRLLWRPIYNFLARKVPQQDWQVMNYGYAPAPQEGKDVKLPGQLEYQRYQFQMYHYLGNLGPITGKDVLEVGSGRGGGAHYIYNNLNPKSVVGLDISDCAVDFCRKQYKGERLHFVVGDAEKIPFGDAQFDVVINIESSRHYGSFTRFMSEVKRVLKPGGKLLLADMRKKNEISQFFRQIRDSGMKVLLRENITENVLASLKASNYLREVEIEKKVPHYFRRYFKHFSGAEGTINYTQLQKGKRYYFRYVLQKT